MESFTARRDKSLWLWTLMITVRAHVTAEMFAAGFAMVSEKKSVLPSLPSVRLEILHEGMCVQTLHRGPGPFDDEGPVLADIHHRFLPEQRLTITGRHHDVYLSDLRRT